MIDKKLGRNLFIVTNKLKRLLDKRYSKIGLYVGQARILGHLYRNKDEIVYQKNIENTFDIRGGTVTGVIDSLVSQNYIQRIESEIDKRKKKIVLTDSGEEVAIKCFEIITEVEGKLSNILTEEERNIFYQLMDKINNWLDEEEIKWENYLNILIQLKRN